MIKLINLLKENPKKYIVYLDIDDTLTNYTERLRTLKIIDPESKQKRPIKNTDTVFIPEFWTEANWLPGAEEMVDFIKNNFNNIQTLSAIPNPDQYPIPKEGKEKWIKKNIGNIKTNWTIGNNKTGWASPDAILIDDKIKNIQNFEKAGGIGILMDNPSNVIKKLKKYLL